jgi:hypothetical protein
MREHLGIDVDSLDEETFATNEPVQPTTEQEVWDPDAEQGYGQQDIVSHIRPSGLRKISEVLDSMGQGGKYHFPVFSANVVFQQL